MNKIKARGATQNNQTEIDCIAATLPPLMTPRQLSEITTIAEGTLANWRSQGKGPAFWRPNGGRVFYKNLDVAKWMATTIA